MASGNLPGRRLSAGWAAVPLLGFLTVLFTWPVLRLLALSFDNHGPSLANYARIIAVPIYRVAIIETFEIATVTTLLCVIIGLPVAYLLAVSPPWLRRILMMLVLLPFWTSALVRTTAWIILLQPNGIVNTALLGAGLTTHPIAFVYNLAGVLIGMTHVLMPFVVLPLYASFRALDATLPQAAEGLGAGSWSVLRRIILPLIRPGLLAGAVIVFMSALGYYITPALMGGPAQTMITQLIEYNINTQLNWGLAAALSVMLLVATLLVFGVFQAAFGVDQLVAQASAGTGDLAATERRGARRVVLTIAAGFVLAFLIAPVLIIFPLSVGSSPILAFPSPHLTWEWYQQLIAQPQWRRALVNSLIVTAIAVPGAVVLGTAAAIGLQALPRRWQRWVETYVVLPMIVPPMILAIGLYYLLAPLGLVAGPWGLALGHIILASPFVVLTVRASVQSLDPTLAQAAEGLGASRAVAFRRIVLPQLLPGIVSGAVFAFITSFDDVVLALFLTNLRSRTLPKLMFDSVAQQLDPTITAASAVIIFLTIAVLIISFACGNGQRRAA
jgi:putative spermidine/putrescine transport system permease protein